MVRNVDRNYYLHTMLQISILFPVGGGGHCPQAPLSYELALTTLQGFHLPHLARLSPSNFGKLITNYVIFTYHLYGSKYAVSAYFTIADEAMFNLIHKLRME